MKVVKYWYRHFGFFPYVFVWILKNWIDVPTWISQPLGLIAISWIIFVIYTVGFRDQG
jgi:hypothetical protein